MSLAFISTFSHAYTHAPPISDSLKVYIEAQTYRLRSFQSRSSFFANTNVLSAVIFCQFKFTWTYSYVSSSHQFRTVHLILVSKLDCKYSVSDAPLPHTRRVPPDESNLPRPLPPRAGSNASPQTHFICLPWYDTCKWQLQNRTRLNFMAKENKLKDKVKVIRDLFGSKRTARLTTFIAPEFCRSHLSMFH